MIIQCPNKYHPYTSSSISKIKPDNVQVKKAHEKNVAALEKRREEYSQANKTQKESMRASLLELERKVLAEEENLADTEIKIRNIEKKHITK